MNETEILYFESVLLDIILIDFDDIDWFDDRNI